MDASCLNGDLFEETKSYAKREASAHQFLIPNSGYPYDQDDPAREDPAAGRDRVVRGGAWLDGQDYARCAYRLRLPPDNRYYDLGFRVVLRSPLLP